MEPLLTFFCLLLGKGNKHDWSGSAVAEAGGRPVYGKALNVFLCCPQALVAVNRRVDFTGHAAPLELADTEVGEDHWSRRTGG